MHAFLKTSFELVPPFHFEASHFATESRVVWHEFPALACFDAKVLASNVPVVA